MSYGIFCFSKNNKTLKYLPLNGSIILQNIYIYASTKYIIPNFSTIEVVLYEPFDGHYPFKKQSIK